jgi:hypothetical protein
LFAEKRLTVQECDLAPLKLYEGAAQRSIIVALAMGTPHLTFYSRQK